MEIYGNIWIKDVMGMKMLEFRKKKDAEPEVRHLPILQIVPNPMQPRRTFAPEELVSLAASIRENGLLQPITVRQVGEHFELIAGERRLRASKMAGLLTIPALVREADDNTSAVLALIENIQREDLSFVEEAMALRRLIERHQYTQDDVARLIGKNQSTVANKLRILRLPSTILRAVSEHGLTERHARALLKVEDRDKLPQIVETIVKYGYNVAQTEKYIESLQTEHQKHKPQKMLVVKDIRLFLNTIDKALEKMKDAGIPATAVSVDHDAFIEYTIKIPKVGQKARQFPA